MATFERIQTTTLTSNASSLAFSNIPQTYTNLQIHYSARSTSTSGLARALNMFFNTSGTIGTTTASNYTMTSLITKDDATATFARFGTSTGLMPYLYGIPSANATASTFGAGNIIIYDYTSSTYYKKATFEVWAESNHSALTGGTSVASVGSALWGVASAVTAITFFADNGDFLSGTSFSLYGIKNS